MQQSSSSSSAFVSSGATTGIFIRYNIIHYEVESSSGTFEKRRSGRRRRPFLTCMYNILSSDVNLAKKHNFMYASNECTRSLHRNGILHSIDFNRNHRTSFLFFHFDFILYLFISLFIYLVLFLIDFYAAPYARVFANLCVMYA